MAGESLPRCGIYRTTKAIADVPAGRLVYFHNHGEPGPGVYFPKSWQLNRARFEERGITVPAPVERFAETLLALPPEGFYRVKRAFTCCEKRCVTFEEDLLVQLGYDGQGRALIFVPELAHNGFSIPEQGRLIDDQRWENLTRVKVAEPAAQDERPSMLH